MYDVFESETWLELYDFIILINSMDNNVKEAALDIVRWFFQLLALRVFSVRR